MPERDEVRLGIAGIVVSLSRVSSNMALQTGEVRARFLVLDAPPQTRLSAAWGTLSPRVEGQVIFESTGLWTLFRSEDGSLLFRLVSPAFGETPYKVARLTPDLTEGEILLHRPYFPDETPVDPLGYPLDELLIVHLLAQGRGVEVHGCGVVDAQGDGRLFVGQSGAGKTTLARLWVGVPGVEILSDDRIILRPDNGGIRMHGTPWHGEANLASPASAPLRGIYFIRHGSSNHLAPLDRAQAAARLLACSFVPFHSPEGLDFTLGFLEKVVDTVPCHEFTLLPDQRAVAFLQGHAREP